MGFLPRFSRKAAADTAISLDPADAYELGPTRDVERFLRALPLLVPEGGFAYFEATGERHVAEYLQGVSVPPAVQVARGTIWPRPDVYHVPLTVDSMESLAKYLEQHPAGYFCSHCHVYHGRSVLLQWHDAFFDDPMFVARALPEAVVDRFAQAAGIARR